MPRIADEPTPTEELRLPRFPGDATLHVPPGEAGLRDALQRLRLGDHQFATPGRLLGCIESPTDAGGRIQRRA
jgi:hypothetical protein